MLNRYLHLDLRRLEICRRQNAENVANPYLTRISLSSVGYSRLMVISLPRICMWGCE
jgi:hypothetical protein